MQKEQYLSALHDDAAALAAAARLRLDTPVPSCPGWSLADLVTHVGGVHRAQANLVQTRSQEPAGLKREMFATVPGLLDWFEQSTLMGGETDLAAIPPGLIEWFEEGALLVETALREADLDEPVWSWSRDQSVAHYLRLLSIETAVHRWDSQRAHGRPDPVDSVLARDGISHTFEIMAPFRRAHAKAPAGEGETYLFRETDSDQTWIVQFTGDDVALIEQLAVADVSIIGSASDLMLFLWGRVSGTQLEVSGDRRRLDRYFELVPPL